LTEREQVKFDKELKRKRGPGYMEPDSTAKKPQRAKVSQQLPPEFAGIVDPPV